MYEPAVEDVLYFRIAGVEVSEPLRKLGSSSHEVIEQLTRLELTEVTDSQERQQKRYICQRQTVGYYTVRIEM